MTRKVAERLIERGSADDGDALEEIYDTDQYLLLLEGDGTVRRGGRAENLESFRAWRDAGEAPLSTEAKFLHIEEQADSAVVPLEPSRLFELLLRTTGAEWKVSGETVTPWPADRPDKG